MNSVVQQFISMTNVYSNQTMKSFVYVGSTDDAWRRLHGLRRPSTGQIQAQEGFNTLFARVAGLNKEEQ